jgi:hypothetical protein
MAAMQDGEVTDSFGLGIVAGCAAAGLLMGAAAVFLPLYFGAKNMRRMEF